MILGCGRSGTSIFGELFHGLGKYVYHSEPAFGDILEHPSTPPVAIKVPKESATHPPDKGLSFPLDTWLRTHPSTIFFWIVRHPLDAISSLRVGIQANWGHHPRPTDWQDWLERPLVERCAHHWSFVNEYGYARVSKIAMLMRFEDMIRDPYEFSVEVCDRVGLSADENRDALDSWANRVQNSNNKDFVEAETSRHYSRPDHSVRVGRWRESLSAEEHDQAVQIIALANERFNYDLS